MKQQSTIKITRKGSSNKSAVKITRTPKIIPVPYGLKGGGQLAMKSKKKKTVKKKKK